MTIEDAARLAADRDLQLLQRAVGNSRMQSLDLGDLYVRAFRQGAQQALPALDDILIRQLHACDREGLLEWISEQYRRLKGGDTSANEGRDSQSLSLSQTNARSS